jgi:biopolymer transport protein ExbD
VAPVTEVTMVSMSDIAMLLIIFFILTSSFLRDMGLEVKLPAAATAAESQPSEASITVTADERIFLNGRETALESLPGQLDQALGASKDRVVTLRGDSSVRYGIMVELMDVVNRCDAYLVVATEKGKGRE